MLRRGTLEAVHPQPLGTAALCIDSASFLTLQWHFMISIRGCPCIKGMPLGTWPRQETTTGVMDEMLIKCAKQRALRALGHSIRSAITAPGTQHGAVWLPAATGQVFPSGGSPACPSTAPGLLLQRGRPRLVLPGRHKNRPHWGGVLLCLIQRAQRCYRLQLRRRTPLLLLPELRVGLPLPLLLPGQGDQRQRRPRLGV